jgi:uncharacterized damage-inducible protein DinB
MTRHTSILAILGCAAAALASAQAPATTSTQMPPRPAAVVAAPAPGFRAEYAAEVDSVGKKLTDLAEAIPADKYGWRPATGVRSVGEVFMHVVGGNSYIPTFLGAKPMAGVTRDSEKTVTDKAQIVDLLKKSLAHAKAAGLAVSDADLEKKVKTFGGREMTERQVLTLILNHLHEHLGQEIAYARSIGVTPPWSQGE